MKPFEFKRVICAVLLIWDIVKGFLKPLRLYDIDYVDKYGAFWS